MIEYICLFESMTGAKMCFDCPAGADTEHQGAIKCQLCKEGRSLLQYSQKI